MCPYAGNHKLSFGIPAYKYLSRRLRLVGCSLVADLTPMYEEGFRFRVVES